MKNIIKIAQNIFSVKNKKHHKILKILGIKLNFKNYKKILKIKNVQIDELNNNYKQVCNILQEKENLIKKLYIDHDKIANQTQQIDELHAKYNKLFNYIKYESTPTIINNVGELLGLSNNTDNKQIMKKNLTQVEIEIFSYYNRTCWFCPNSIIDRHSENHFMPEEQYLKILEQLKEINYSNIITYSRYNEPLSNREIFIKRIKQARKYCPNAFIRTNSNGDFLTSLEYLDEIAAAGINEIDVQCYLNENEEYTLETFKNKANKFTKRLNLDYELIKTPECIIAHFKYNKINIGYFMRDFKKIANNRGETLTKKVRPYYRNSSCVVPFQHLYIDYTGDVMLCCNMRHDIQAHQNFILGNAFNETLANIFMGNKIIEYRKLLACNGKKIHPCYSCSFTASTEKMNLIEAPLNN